MITTKQKIIEMCVERGMLEAQANEVIEKAMVELDECNMKWDAPLDSYPEYNLFLTFELVKCVALDWIDENKPNAWLRGMFEK